MKFDISFIMVMICNTWHVKRHVIQLPAFPEDTTTLLMYLRYAKFSQLRAREVIEKNCLLFVKAPNIFTEFDTHNEDVIGLLKTG